MDQDIYYKSQKNSYLRLKSYLKKKSQFKKINMGGSKKSYLRLKAYLKKLHLKKRKIMYFFLNETTLYFYL